MNILLTKKTVMMEIPWNLSQCTWSRLCGSTELKTFYEHKKKLREFITDQKKTLALKNFYTDFQKKIIFNFLLSSKKQKLL